MVTAMFFIGVYSFPFSSYASAERQSQSTNTICYGSANSCYTTFCSDNQQCQTLSSDRPDEEDTVMQPDEEDTVMQPDEEDTVMQPVEVTEKYVDATLEDCDDGQDNDVDGKVDDIDEECNASTSNRSPVQGLEPFQLDNYGHDDGQNERSDDGGGGGDNKDEYNEQEDSEDYN
jgi:hypothetical protein